ncbi:MAG: Holliday junction branch migration protein RuvA [Candidatus Omnitrophota bacterium]
MIVHLTGSVVKKTENSLVIDVGGISYEVLVSAPVLQRVSENIDQEGKLRLVIYHYFQIGPGSGIPILVGFLNELEKDFFLQFIKVSGIGPRAAIRALNRPTSEISSAIEGGDQQYLKTLPGIGVQKAKEIIAKLQGKIGRYGLIQDKAMRAREVQGAPDWQQEALDVLLQLQYKKAEAVEMIEKALQRSTDIQSAEGLLNEIYKQRAKK